MFSLLYGMQTVVAGLSVWSLLQHLNRAELRGEPPSSWTARHWIPSFLSSLVPLLLEPSAPFWGLFAFMMSRTGKWLITIVPQSLENFLKQTAHCLTCCPAQVSKTPGEEVKTCGNAALVS